MDIGILLYLLSYYYQKIRFRLDTVSFLTMNLSYQYVVHVIVIDWKTFPKYWYNSVFFRKFELEREWKVQSKYRKNTSVYIDNIKIER